MPDLWFYGILNFLKKGRGSSNFRKIRAIVLKLRTNILHPSRNLGIEFCQNRLKRSNFFRFWIFWEFFQNCLTQANFDLSSWNFVGKCTNTEWCLIPNFIRIGGDLKILDEFDFFIFFIVTSNYKNSMYPRSFFCETAKIKQRTPWKKKFCEIGEEAIWESRFTSFLVSPENSVLFSQIMDLAKDLAWQKIFSDRSTNHENWKNGFFLHFRYSHPLFHLISR